MISPKMKTTFNWVRLFLSIALTTITLGCAVLLPSEVRYTQQDLQERMTKRFPWNKTFLGIFELTLINPAIKLDELRNRVATGFDVQLTVKGLERNFTGRTTLSGLPRYDADKRAFFLHDAAVDELNIDGMPPRLATQFKNLAASLAPDVFNTTPLYSLRPDEGKYLGTELIARDVQVKGGQLVMGLQRKGLQRK
jgi:Protein of unknown function (DUF1439)